MSLIRISFNNGRAAIFVPDRFFDIFRQLLDTVKRDFEVAKVTEMKGNEMIDADGTIWLPFEFFTVIVAEKIREGKKRR